LLQDRPLPQGSHPLAANVDIVVSTADLSTPLRAVE
jgi:hypothetical protein